MITLVLAGYGSEAAVKGMVSMVSKYIQAYITDHNANIYSEATLRKAEYDREVLQKRSRFTLSVGRGVHCKSYLGVLNCHDTDALAQRIFAPVQPRGSATRMPVYFSRDQFAQWVNESFGGSTWDQPVPMAGDFEIWHQYGCTEQEGKLDSILQWGFDEHSLWVDAAKTTEMFQELILRLDKQAPDAFVSGYITNCASGLEPTAHLRLYKKYQPEHISRYLLGAEYCIYIGKQLQALQPFPSELPSMQCSKTENGSMYIYENSFFAFDQNQRDRLCAVLAPFLIPAYSVYGWSQLYSSGLRFYQKPQSIHVYRGAFFDGITDPYIVFAHGLSSDELDRILEKQWRSSGAMYRIALNNKAL